MQIEKYLKALLVTFVFIFQACSFFEKPFEEDAVARVKDYYLSKSELAEAIPEGLVGADSIIWAKNYINEWATDKLMYQKAKLNLDASKEKALEKLVSDYRNELFIKTYKEALISASIDTIVSDSTIQAYYQADKDNFKLNEYLLRLRYLTVSKNYYNLPELSIRLQRFNTKDKKHLDSIAIQFKRYSLNDASWIRLSDVLQGIAPLRDISRSDYLIKPKFITLKDSIDIYLVYITDVLSANKQAPMNYVKSRIKQIILNQRKIEYLRKLDQDLLNNAIKKKQFQLYE